MFHFDDNYEGYACSDCFIAVFSTPIYTQDELLVEISAKLKFPLGFGFNWNALYDFLRDLYWIEEFSVVLIHTTLPSIPDPELKIYLEILSYSLDSWVGDSQHSFKVVLPTDTESRVLALLGS